MISLRVMTPADIPAGLTLCRQAGWNQVASDWELFLQANPSGCAVAVGTRGRIVGTATTIKYEDHFSWVGMVLVEAAQRKKGIGTQLLKWCLDNLKGEGTVKLDATPAGRDVYLKLGFKDEYSLSRMVWNESSKSITSPLPVQPVDEKAFKSILAVDAMVFGADRERVLRWIWQGAPNLALFTSDSGGITGYCFGRRGHLYTHVGPLIASGLENATSLASAALARCAGRPAVMDSPDHQGAWQSWLSALGFVKQRSLTRMHRGINAFPGQPPMQFAVLGPEFG